MASLESHYGNFRIVFRVGGQKICRSLKTSNERTAKAAHGSFRIVFRFGGRKFTRFLNTENGRTANAALARLEETLARLAVG